MTHNPDLKRWRAAIAQSFGEGLGQAGEPVPNIDHVGSMNVAPMLMVQQGRDGDYINFDDEESNTFCTSMVKFSVWVFVSRSSDLAKGHDLADLFIGRIPQALDNLTKHDVNHKMVKPYYTGISEPELVEYDGKGYYSFNIGLDLQIF